VVAPHGDRAQLLQSGEGLGRPERAGDAVAEVDDDVGAAARAQVMEHGFEGEDVAVDVGDDGDPHEGVLAGGGGMAKGTATAEAR